MRFNKDIEYALMALVTIRDGEIYSASRIAQESGVPYKLLCKLLQKLNQEGIVDSIQGPKGGYRMIRSAGEITLQDVVSAIHEDTQIINCSGENCRKTAKCVIQAGMLAMQEVWDSLLSHITLEKFLVMDRRNSMELIRKALAG